MRFMCRNLLPRRLLALAFAISLGAIIPSPAPADDETYFRVTVVDQETGRGVPLVELSTVNDIRYWTDSAGVVAFREPGLMGRRVFFNVRSHGYESPKDGFGFPGLALDVKAGGDATVELRRTNLAERLYRVTGAGIYRDSVLLGDEPPIAEPVLNAGVLGSDSVVNAVYRGRIYWFWGDTKRARHPLGNFHVPGATSRLPEDGGLDPDAGVDLEYFVAPDGFAKETCRMPGEGPTWIDGLTVLRDSDGGERMFAKYVKIKPPLEVYERGLVEFDPEADEFRKVCVFPEDAAMYPGGHLLPHASGNIEHVYFPQPLPLIRVRANAESLQDLSQYEAYTYFTPGSRPDQYELDRDANGRLRLSWKRDTLPPSRELEEKLVADGRLKESERLFDLRDADTGKRVQLHSASLAYNPYRGRFTMIALERFGTSALGEIWYAEADRLEGPWSAARKVVTHEKYSFYNPKQHPMLAKDRGRTIYFEATYTTLFSGAPSPTPRYDYNQIMYRLDVDAARGKEEATSDDGSRQ